MHRFLFYIFAHIFVKSFSLRIIEDQRKMKTEKQIDYSLVRLAEYVHAHVTALNGSKFFAGVMIIILNIASRFVNIKLSKTMESYLKYTFSRQILVFAITWMGTRDIYVALIFTILFSIFVDCLFNEESRFCCLPSHFTDYHMKLLENSIQDPSGIIMKRENMNDLAKSNNGLVTDEEVKYAKDVLKKYESQSQKSNNYQGFYKGDFVSMMQ